MPGRIFIRQETPERGRWIVVVTNGRGAAEQASDHENELDAVAAAKALGKARAFPVYRGPLQELIQVARAPKSWPERICGYLIKGMLSLPLFGMLVGWIGARLTRFDQHIAQVFEEVRDVSQFCLFAGGSLVVFIVPTFAIVRAFRKRGRRSPSVARN